MTVVAQDTKNEFAAAWNGERPSALPAAVGQDPSRSAEENEYRAAWDRENHGVYGDINLRPIPAPVTSLPQEGPKFRQQTVPWTDLQRQLISSGRSPWMMGGSPDGWVNSGGAAGTYRGDGGYGSFTYGMDVKEGTAEYRDMQEYMLNGGYDPYGMYGDRKYGHTGNAYADAWGGGGNSGDSVGGSAAADGSGGGGPGTF